MKVYRCFLLMFNCLLAAYCIKFHMCSFCIKGVERFKQALEISPESVSARYGIASGLLGLAKAWINLGAFRWGASLLEVSCFLKFICLTILKDKHFKLIAGSIWGCKSKYTFGWEYVMYLEVTGWYSGKIKSSFDHPWILISTLCTVCGKFLYSSMQDVYQFV